MNKLRSCAMLLLTAFFTVLSGCQKHEVKYSSDNPIALADKQRHAVILQTRDASYSVFPDVADPETLKDKTFLEAIVAESPMGSAFGVRADGIVFTNVHVVEASGCRVKDNQDPRVPPASEFFRRQEEKGVIHCLLLKADSSHVYRAKVINLDKGNDIAALQIEDGGDSFPFLRIADPENFSDGAEVFTIGAPFGNKNMMTPGYVSNVSFLMPTPEGAGEPARKLQFSAPVLPGNSGGPLVSFATGEVVGQVVMIFAPHGFPTQMSYANPVEFLRKNLDSIPKKNSHLPQ